MAIVVVPVYTVADVHSGRVRYARPCSFHSVPTLTTAIHQREPLAAAIHGYCSVRDRYLYLRETKLKQLRPSLLQTMIANGIVRHFCSDVLLTHGFNKLHRITERDSRPAHYFALFWGLGLPLGYLATPSAKSDVIFLLSHPDFVYGDEILRVSRVVFEI